MLGAALAALIAGCGDWDLSHLYKKPPAPEATPRPERSVDPMFRDTIGAVTLYSGISPLRVRGFGLVVGLGEMGSRDCPTSVREYLIDFMNKEYTPAGPGAHRSQFSASKLIDSLDSAVVEVSALIAPGAAKGASFDLAVEVVPGTDTRTLEGGLLLPTELRIFDVASSGQGMLAGRVVARANGPVFVSPFADDAEDDMMNPRRGIVLGGGRMLEERTVQLQMIEPSYPLARRIERRINERFGQSPRTSEALSQGALTLHTPREYVSEPDRFLRILPYVFLPEGGGFEEQRLIELVEMAGRADADMEQISAAWEAMGRSALPQLQALYSSNQPAISYYAARTGLRMGDSQAAQVVAQFASQTNGRYAVDALRVLARSRYTHVVERLVPLLSSENPEIRVAACDTLLAFRHPLVRSSIFQSVLDKSQVNLVLDVVDSGGSPMIYFRRSRMPRIIVFGAKLPVSLPAFHTHGDELVTISAVDGARELTVFARGRVSRQLSQKINIPPRVPELIAAMAGMPLKDGKGQLRGLGLPYSTIVAVLAELCDPDNRTIRAQFVQEPVSLRELLEPEQPMERPIVDDAMGAPSMDVRTNGDASRGEPPALTEPPVLKPSSGPPPNAGRADGDHGGGRR